MAMSEGRVPDALELYRKAIPQERDDEAWIHVERARAFHMLGNEDSTRAELAQGLEKLRKRDQKAFVFVYESKALLEHCIGLTRSEEHTSELQSRLHLVCRLLLEKT